MTAHVRVAVQKALQKQAALARIMPRVGGPSSSKRRVLATVVQSVILYGAPAWEVALKYQKYVRLLRMSDIRHTRALHIAMRAV